MGRPVAALVRSVGRRIDEMERRSELMSNEVGRGVKINIPPLSSSFLTSEGSGEALPSGGAGAEPPQLLPLDSPDAMDEVQIPAIANTLPEVSDRRLFNPDTVVTPLRRVSSRPVRRLRVAPATQRALAEVPAGISVPAKASVIMCIRRKNRRGVLLALGQGGGYHKPPRRSPTSDIWC